MWLAQLFSDLEIARGDGCFDRLFRKIARVDLVRRAVLPLEGPLTPLTPR